MEFESQKTPSLNKSNSDAAGQFRGAYGGENAHYYGNTGSQYHHAPSHPNTGPHFNNFSHRFTPYFNKRSCAYSAQQQQHQQRRFNYSYVAPSDCENAFGANERQPDLKNNVGASADSHHHSSMWGSANGAASNNVSSFEPAAGANSSVTLQISNLDTAMDERTLKSILIGKLKPITSVLSIYFEAVSVAKIKLPTAHHAKLAIAHLHRKKIGHKRITVSYTRDSSSMEPSTLRCQVAGLLKDIPHYKLSMYKFRELFQSRFKTSISVTDLYDMKDICTIIEDKNDDKYITLRTELINSIENSELMDCLQHSVPYCTAHFVKSHRGWAEQEIDPLPNVVMTVGEARSIVYALLKSHKGDIPIASIVHCIHAELQIQLVRNETGVNFEHLLSCVPGVQIVANKFNIKMLTWVNPETATKENSSDEIVNGRYYNNKGGNIPDFSQVSREIVELIKLSPKATLKFSRFIPAYHNHLGKQCRVADYGYTKLIDLFEALSPVVQVMGVGENRQITLTHKTQVRRFSSDLLRILRNQSSKSVMLSQLPLIYEQVQARKFDITDYGVCDVKDILEGTVNSNVVVVNRVNLSPHMVDIMITIPKKKQTALEIERTSVFAGEVVELFKHASQFNILFEKFACSYHYHFGYQCRLCDYGFSKLADLMEAITGIVEMEFSNDEDRKIYLSPKAAQRIFSEQLMSLVEMFAGSSDAMINLHEVLVFHKKQYGYQIIPQSLGFEDMLDCIKSLPYIEVITQNGFLFIRCHHNDQPFRQKCYAACRILQEAEQQAMPFTEFVKAFAATYNEILIDRIVESMKHAIEIQYVKDVKYVTITKLMRFVIHIIGVVEQRGVMKIPDLKAALNLSINGCFPFGFPNLSSLIQSFPDVFVSTSSKPINHRGEIKLNPQCILTKEGSTNHVYSGNMNSSLSTSLTESSALSKSLHSVSMSSYNSTNNVNMPNEPVPYPMFDNIPMVTNTSCDYSQFQDMILPENTNTSQLYNVSNSSFNLSASSTHDSGNMTGSFEKKENFFHLGDSLNSQSESQSVLSASAQSASERESSFNDFGEIVNKNCLLDLYFYPPKPDTPPHIPYWLDPVWKREPLSPKVDSLNINIPELKLFNVMPKLDTPTVMASMKKSSLYSSDNKENLN